MSLQGWLVPGGGYSRSTWGFSTKGVGTQRGEYPGSEYLEVGTHPLDMGPAGGGLVT